MKVTIFTSNQPRHLTLINRLASISDTTYAIMECSTVVPGLVEDFFRKSATMKEYFSSVMAAEQRLFGNLSFMKGNVRSLCIRSGDLNFLQQHQIQDALESDVYVVFGASYIKGWLIDYLVERGAGTSTWGSRRITAAPPKTSGHSTTGSPSTSVRHYTC